MRLSEHRGKVAEYVSNLNDFIEAYFSSINSKRLAFKIVAVWGARYIRLDAHKKDKSVETWGFLDQWNGDCLKAASYKSPSEKTPRGNIFDGDFGMSHVTWSGYEDIENGSGWPKDLRLQGVYPNRKKA